MSEMVLRLPSSFVDVERDEMEYIDGGFEKIVSASTCADLAAICAGGSVALFTVAGILGLTGVGIPVAIALTIAGGVVGLGSAYLWYCSNRKGLDISWSIWNGIDIHRIS